MSDERNEGRIVAIQRSVIDVRFVDQAPGLNAQLLAGDRDEIAIEVAGIVGPGTVHGLVLTPNDELSLGMPVTDSGAPPQVPVGRSPLSRMLNVFGEPIDLEGPIEDVEYRDIKGKRVPLSKRRVAGEIFETGIKAIDHLSPLERGGKAGLFGGAGDGSP